VGEDGDEEGALGEGALGALAALLGGSLSRALPLPCSARRAGYLLLQIVRTSTRIWRSTRHWEFENSTSPSLGHGASACPVTSSTSITTSTMPRMISKVFIPDTC
jgi:hypothetical protein